MAFDIPVQFINSKSNSVVSSFSAIDLLGELEAESYGLFRTAVDEIKIIAIKYIIVVALSFGKDSTVTLLASLLAHLELIKEGKIPPDKPFVICHIDTGVENHLVQMLAKSGLRDLKRFAAKHNINLDIRVGQPPLSKQWASLFLSGLKLISASRLNNDCSVILKLDNAAAIERSIVADYGNDNIVTMLGSRLTESAKRAASIRKFGNEITAAELIEFDKADMVFAPIVSWTDDHVWTVLKHAGVYPISSSVLGNEPIFSYAPNHRLLHVVYSDSKDGSCPTSSKRIAGDSSSQGGCGGSARTGCYLCAKSIIDRSAEAQAKMKRHSVISANILKVRNYIMSVAQNIEHRTWLAKAVDHTTGAIALQPNTLNAETIDKLLWLLSQATHDEIHRANRFKHLVSFGREMEDEGYADIINDESMTSLDREAMASAYLEFAQIPLIKPMSLELALYISAIHSRDGVKLPPYRAVYVWKATERGERIPYPDVDPTAAVIDDIPDPVMVIPADNFNHQPAFRIAGLFEVEEATGCDASAILKSCNVPVSIAKYYLPETELNKIDHLSPSSGITISGLSEYSIGRKMLVEQKRVSPKLRFSKRTIKKVSRKNGGFRVLERSRTSLDTPSFGARSARPNLEAKLTQPLIAYLPTTEYVRDVLLEIDDNQNGYDVDYQSVLSWLDYGGLKSAIQAHDRFIEISTMHDGHFYYFGGTGAFESLLRYGVLRINSNSKTNLMRIIQRTNYFASIGLLSIDEKSIKQLAHERVITGSLINQYRENIKVDLPIKVEQALSMTEFRSYKARALLKLRADRNLARAALKSDYKAFSQDSIGFVLDQYQKTMDDLKLCYRDALVKSWICGSLRNIGIGFFDGVNLHQQANINQGTVNYLKAWTTDIELAWSLGDKAVQNVFKENPQARLRLINAMEEHEKVLQQLSLDIASSLLESLNDNELGFPMWPAFYLNDKATRALKATCETVIAASQVDNKSSLFKKCFSMNDTLLHTGVMQW